MPAESSALQELKNLINQSSQEIEALTKNAQENEPIDTFITTQALRTLHSIKGLANLCGLTQAATIAHALETTVDDLAKNKIPATQETMTLIGNANNVLFSILQHGEQALAQTIQEILNKLTHKTQPQEQQPTPPAATTPDQTQTLAEKINLSAFGLVEGDFIQLGETEKMMINQLYEKKRPIAGYLVHFNVPQLEENVEKVESEITANGSLISIIPTHSRQSNYRFAFVFLFTTALSPEELMKTFSFPGKLTWLEKEKAIQVFEVDNAHILRDASLRAAPQDERDKEPTETSTKTKSISPTTNPHDKNESASTTSARPEEPAEALAKAGHLEGHERNKNMSASTNASPTSTPVMRSLGEGGITLTAEMAEKMQTQKKEDPILHIPLSKIDKLIDQNNKLLSSKIKLQRLIKKLKIEDKKWQTINMMEEQVTLLDKHLKLMQQAILDARLVKVSDVFDNLSQLVKSIANETDKKIDFQLVGKEIEIDRSILENLQNPIMHLIKNAADHGIKKPAERQEKGKPPQGLIKISFIQQEDSVLVSISDDGEGLDVKAIRKKALEMQLVDPIKAATMSNEEWYQIIFLPGFSTKETLTQTSGRGIGMDAVKNTIIKMHGELMLASTPGQGTTFTITIPTYLSIQRLLRFSVNHQHYALPFSCILEVLLYDKNRLQGVGNKLLYAWQAKPLIAIDLHKVLNKQNANAPLLEKSNIIIFKKADQPIALLVDEIFGQEEIIVRPLDQAGKKEFDLYNGYADFGDEKLVLLINVDKLWELIKHEYL